MGDPTRNYEKVLSQAAVGQSGKVVAPLADNAASLSRAMAADEREPEILREALNRGANDDELFDLLYRYRHKPPARGGMSLDAAGSEEVWADVTLAIRGYRVQVTNEFNNLPSHVRPSFGTPGKRYNHEEALANYFQIRPEYYNAGYSDPAVAVFGRIVGNATLLNHPVSGGLHEEFVSRLSSLKETLEEWSVGLSDRVAAQITRAVGGFVPRFVRDSPGKLSNHAFGLAIDIDHQTNPYLNKPDVIQALNWVVRDTKFDFGKLYVEEDDGIGDMDRAVQIYARAASASQIVQSWLRQHLPNYRVLKYRIEAAQKILKTATPWSAEYIEAKEALDAAIRTIKEDQDLSRLDVLASHHKQQIEEWAEHGIQTIPMYLAVALTALGFRWGQSYKSKKDAMHFELLAERVIPHDPARGGLDDLLRNR